MSTGADYTTLDRVLSALYAGMGQAPGDPAPTDATRDARLRSLITATSRDFDREVAGESYPGLFAPKYEVRLFSGKGEQVLKIDPLVAVNTVMYNSTPGRTPTWQDISGELGTYQMGLLPVDTRPVKHSIFRQQGFYEDPFPLGNIQIGAVWGVVLPDLTAAAPAAGWNGLTGLQITALAPAAGGWWVTPDDVMAAMDRWVVYRFEEAKAGYGEEPGSASAAGTQGIHYPSSIPQDVQRVIDHYKGEDSDYPKFALVGSDPDITSSPYRWRDWVATQ